MVAYRNTKTGRIVRLSAPNGPMDRSARWERVEPGEAATESPAPWPAPNPDPGAVFDPGEHTVAQVNAHLAGADVGERERVIQAECEGRSRRGIIQGPHADLSGS